MSLKIDSFRPPLSFSSFTDNPKRWEIPKSRSQIDKDVMKLLSSFYLMGMANKKKARMDAKLLNETQDRKGEGKGFSSPTFSLRKILIDGK